MLFVVMFVSVVVVSFLYMYLPDERGYKLRRIMDHERATAPKRQQIVQGMFRNHNHTFATCGLKKSDDGNKGSA